MKPQAILARKTMIKYGSMTNNLNGQMIDTVQVEYKYQIELAKRAKAHNTKTQRKWKIWEKRHRINWIRESNFLLLYRTSNNLLLWIHQEPMK